MKNLAILAIVTCLTMISNAQVLETATVDSLNKAVVQQNLLLSIPLLGNIIVKKASYAFQEATMPFQIDVTELDVAGKESTDTVAVPAAYSIRPEEDSLTANNKERRL